MPSIEVDGTQLEYVEQGRGEPVVLVHGTLGDLRSWELQMSPFAERYRTISYSRRYHHPNPWQGDGSDYSPTLHADDLAAFIDGLGLESAHVVGESYGAYTALYLAKRHPERIRTLVLGEPPVLPLLEDDAEGRALRDEFLATVWNPARHSLLEERAEEAIRTFVGGVAGGGAFDELPEEARRQITDNARELEAEMTAPDYWMPFTCEDAREVTSPTLLLQGEESPPMLQRIVQELEPCLPNSSRAVVPAAGHEMVAENPEAYNEIVLAFLAEHSA